MQFFTLLLLLPLYAAAVEVTGTVTVALEGDQVLPGAGASVPLKKAKVHLGLLEAENIYIYLEPSWSTSTDADGRFAIDLGEDDPPWIVDYTIPYVLVVILESEDGAVAVYDNQLDTDYVACLSTAAFQVANRGVTQADVQIKVRSNNDSSYTMPEGDFRPVEDRQTTFAGTTRCTEPALAPQLALGFPQPYDPNGLTNSRPERFGHLAVHYARSYDAYEFVRDGLGKPGFAPVRVNAWDSFPDMAYSCGENVILMDAGNSYIFGPYQASAVFDLRHEYGHHFMCVSPISGFGNLPPLPAGDRPHAGLANSNSSDSWVEGFATYFAAAVAEFNSEDRPHEQRTATGMLNLLHGGAVLDDPFTSGEQPTFGEFAEEFGIASLLWDISVVSGSDALIGTLEMAVVDPTDFNRVYVSLKADFATASLFDTLPCDFLDTGTTVFGLDCLFIDRGFYHDLSSDGLYGGSEEVGRTRWPLALRGPTVFRPHLPQLEGSILRLSVVDDALQAVSIEGFNVRIVYDAPLEQQSTEYVEKALGAGPWEFAILVPGVSSHAIITPIKTGYAADAPLIIESAFFHDRVNPFRPGGIERILADHSFVLRAVASEGPFNHPSCNDGLDNDANGLIDGDDPNCQPVAFDNDSDGVPDANDNCILVPNGPLDPDNGGSSQLDSDGDGYGNSCDPDFDNNKSIDFADLAYLKSLFFSSDPEADLNGNGSVDFADLAILKSMFFGPPGPSALVP